ncbi:MAG: GNAT family N-acetyltransferase [Sulfurimonas sp.]|nr:GNAT family N-acetyltransferase [Sulfurimonas sp.]MDD5202376.1 GNAT family N-acetyltransferase [Sulfurimonas sp.]
MEIINETNITDVFIRPEYQGQGIGKAIVSKLVEFSKKHNKITLYAKLGFDKMNTAMAIFKNCERGL